MAIINVFNSLSAGTIFLHQNLTYKDGPRAERVNCGSNSQLIVNELDEISR